MYNKITVKDYPLTIPQKGGQNNGRQKEKRQERQRTANHRLSHRAPEPDKLLNRCD